MPRRRIGPEGTATALAKSDLARQLAEELNTEHAFGQPLIYEQTFRTGKRRVTVVWDAWNGLPLQERSATVLRAYELAEGPESRDRIALANGLTFPEAHAAGLLPFRVSAARRASDPVTQEELREVMLQMGASDLGSAGLLLAFATEEEADAAVRELVKRLPQSEPVWLVTRDVRADDSAGMEESAQVAQGED